MQDKSALSLPSNSSRIDDESSNFCLYFREIVKRPSLPKVSFSFSHETSWNSGEAWPDPNKGPKLVRPAGMRVNGRRPLRGSHLAHVEPQVMIRIS